VSVGTCGAPVASSTVVRKLSAYGRTEEQLLFAFGYQDFPIGASKSAASCRNGPGKSGDRYQDDDFARPSARAGTATSLPPEMDAFPFLSSYPGAYQHSHDQGLPVRINTLCKMLSSDNMDV
jgi:hypothetical protein